MDGLPCSRHATEAEAAEIAEVYDAAVEQRACPGCDAAAGERCWTGPDAAAHLRLVDGEWVKVRSFRGRKVRDLRLAAARA